MAQVGRAPGVTIRDFQRQVDAPVGPSLRIECRHEPLAPRTPHKAGAPPNCRIAAQGAHILQQFVRRFVSQRKQLLIHHRVRETSLDQQIAKVMHVDKRRCRGLQACGTERLAKLAQRRWPKARKECQAAHAQHASPLLQPVVRFGMPVQRQV